jgi:hypothetical protein
MVRALTIPLTKSSPKSLRENALLEALLVHLRLFDDFFGSSKQTQPRQRSDRDDVFARHWLPTWRPRGVLSPVQRSRVNAQLAHLTARRRMKNPWTLEMVRRTCRVLIAFLDQLEREQPRRARAFRKSRDEVEALQRRLR